MASSYILQSTTMGGSLVWACCGAIVLAFALLTSHVLNNLFFHPLKNYPGPKSWAATRLQWNRHALKGDLIYAIKALHDEYGPVVRVAPDELDYTTASAWRTIYGHRTPEMSKALDGRGVPPPANGIHGIVTSPRENHARLRKAILPAFSDKALKDQEHFVRQYVELLVAKLSGFADADSPVDLTVWFNYTTFDIIGDLAYGDSFHCLENSNYHPLVKAVFGAVKVTPFLNFFIYYRLQWLIRLIVPKSLIRARQQTAQYSYDTMEKRLNTSRQRKDFVSYIVDKDGVESELARDEIRSISNELIVAGSDTTSRLLAGCTHLVLTHPRVYAKLTAEIRGAFATADDITSVNVNGLSYLLAVLQESLRMYPPSPSTLPRKVPGIGEEIDGRWVPGGTAVGVNQWSASQSSANFHRAQEFIPERWLEASHLPGDLAKEAYLFAKDEKTAMQPFSFGPRSCLGVNLAKMESRLIVANMFWHFDIVMVDPTYDWRDQKVFLGWEKNPLMAKLHKVNG